MANGYKLENLQLYSEEGSWFLKAIYLYENDCGIYEVVVPKIHLIIRKEPIFSRGLCNYHSWIKKPDTIDLGFGDCIMCEDADGAIYYQKLIKEKIHDMTLDEIEKKLGFKVRVISKKEMSEQ